MNKDFLLKYLPAFENKTKVLVDRQNVGDIMSGILYAHEKFKCDYDNIAKFFDRGSIYEICEKIWKFCKKNIPYNIEPDKLQSVRSPAAILAMIDGGDCKNYAQFVGGVLDAISRETGKKIDWFYRFASYDIFDNTPEHVFVVVKDGADEIWIDPVLKSFDARSPVYVYKVDKKPKNKMALVMISGMPQNRQERKAVNGFAFTGTNNVKTTFPHIIAGVPSACIAPPSMGGVRRRKRIGTTAETGKAIMSVAPALAVIPVVGWIAAAAGEIVGFALTAFGNKWHENNEVRWLTAMYEFYVLGNRNVTSDNNVSEADINPAVGWFTAVLGVPIHDRNDLAYIRGVLPGNNQSRGYSYDKRAKDYLAQPVAKGSHVTYAQALQAAQLADELKTNGVAGSWAGFTVAPSLVAQPSASVSDLVSPPSGSGSAVVVNPVSNVLPSGSGISSFFSQSPLLAIALLGGGVYLVSKL